MNITARLPGQAVRRGFTLIELLLTVVLLLVLIGAMVFNFSGLQTGAQLDEGAEQLESAIRYARAYAANTGCRVRLSFEEQVEEGASVPMGNIFASWEPDPLGKPGVYEPLQDVDLLLQSLLQVVEIDDVLPFDTAQTPAPQGSEGELEDEASASFAPITFYPDGSSDSAEIILAARAEEETRRMSVTIIGATGVIRRMILTDAASADEQEFLDATEE